MLENELVELNKAKNEYEIAKRATKLLQDFAYDDNHIKFDDGYYDAIIKSTDSEVSFHLPTVIIAMERHTRNLHEKYIELLGKYNKEV